MLLSLLLKQFKSEKFKVEGVANGLEAMGAVASFKPDLVLLDLVLPGLDGFAILKELKASSDVSKIPVIVLSNLDDEADVKSTIALGAKKHILKVEASLEEIVKIVKNALD